MIILTPISLRQYQVIASLSEISGALERLSFGVICCELLWLLFLIDIYYILKPLNIRSMAFVFYVVDSPQYQDR